MPNGTYITCRRLHMGGGKYREKHKPIPEALSWREHIRVAHERLGWIKWVDDPANVKKQPVDYPSTPKPKENKVSASISAQKKVDDAKDAQMKADSAVKREAPVETKVEKKEAAPKAPAKKTRKKRTKKKVEAKI